MQIYKYIIADFKITTSTDKKAFFQQKKIFFFEMMTIRN